MHGIFTGTFERPFNDFDLKGAYTDALAQLSSSAYELRGYRALVACGRQSTSCLAQPRPVVPRPRPL